MRNKNTLTFLTGASVGFLAGIFTIGPTGKDLRNLFSFKLKKYTGGLFTLATKIWNKESIEINAAKATGKEVVRGAAQRAKKLLKDAKELVKNIETTTTEDAVA